MSDGKAIAQAGHAYLEAYLDATKARPTSAEAYSRLSPGTKIALDGGNTTTLYKIRDTCRDLGIPNRLIIDSGHVEMPHFDGSPIVTALGIGPIDPASARKLVGRLKLWRRKGGGT